MFCWGVCAEILYFTIDMSGIGYSANIFIAICTVLILHLHKTVWWQIQLCSLVVSSYDIPHKEHCNLWLNSCWGFFRFLSKCQHIWKGSGIIIRWDKDPFYFFRQRGNENYLSSKALIIKEKANSAFVSCTFWTAAEIFFEAKAHPESVCVKLELKLIWKIDLNTWTLIVYMQYREFCWGGMTLLL